LKFVLLIFIFAFSTIYASAREQLIFAYQNTDNYPFQVGDGRVIDKTKPGIAVEMIQKMAKDLNLDIKLIRLPWNRALFQLKAGKIHGLFSSSYKKEREKYGVFPKKNNAIDKTRRSYSNSYFIYTLKSSHVNWDGKTIKNNHYPIHAPLGFSIVDDLKSMGLKVTESNSLERDFNLLSLKRIDTLVTLGQTGESFLSKNKDYKDSVKRLTPPLKTKNYYLILSNQFFNKNPKISEKIWNSIKKFRISREYKKLIIKY